MIDAENLTKYYGARAAIRDVSFHVERGEILGLLGPNGAGKTTTMRILTGYMPPSSGKAYVAGFNVTERPLEARKHLGYLPETVPLYTDMTVKTYLDFVAKLRGVDGGRARRERLDIVMDICRVADVQNKQIGRLSRGYKQRVGLAQAIVHNPDVVILDEPTVGLDPRQIIETRQVIRDLAQQHSVILSTHILPEVSMLCNRVVIINQGRVLVDDTLDSLQRESLSTARLQAEVRGPLDAVKAALAGLPDVVRVSVAPPDDAKLEFEGDDSLALQQIDPFDIELDPEYERELAARPTNRYNIETEREADLREKIAALVFGNGWGLIELRSAAPTLEDIFVRLVSSDTTRADEDEAVSLTDGIAPDTAEDEFEAPVSAGAKDDL